MTREEALEYLKGHNPIYSGSNRTGWWGECTCGEWTSEAYDLSSDVRVEFGRHLRDSRPEHIRGPNPNPKLP